MTDTPDIDELAGEYVLGTLSASERALVAARRVSEPSLDAAITQWEVLLGPLHELAGLVTPPDALKTKVLSRINADPSDAKSATVVVLQRRVSRWRMATLGVSALAASLAAFIVARDVLRPAAPKSYVAVLQKDAQSPAFLMTVDIDARSFTVRPVAAERQPGKSYELWLVSQKLGSPKSLGVVGDRAFSVSPGLAAYGAGDIQDATYAVSIEPEGGSPTGAPTGPVVYAGKLVQAKP